MDDLIRLAAFRWLDDLRMRHPDGIPAGVLKTGFEFQGTRVPIVSQQGIFKPSVCTLPLSIRTSPNGPYDDQWSDDGLIYRYRGTDPMHRDNVGLRRAMQESTPLIWFSPVASGIYEPVFPVYIVGDDPPSLSFHVQFDEFLVDISDPPGSEDLARRRYVTRETRVRLHQARFRATVLAAYRSQCGICRLKRRELLDAAHILPDSDPRSLPVVENGLALCRLHHAAYDSYLLGLRPDTLTVEIRDDLLREVDGPMLVHGLQGFQGALIQLPSATRLRPNRQYLEERYELFRAAG